MRNLAASALTAVVLAATLVPIAAGASTLAIVDFTEYACPAGISTPADLEAAGGPDQACAVAGEVGAFVLPEGYSWEITPIEFNLQASLVNRGPRRTNPEPVAGYSCDSNALTCHAFQAYGWFDVPVGSLRLTENTVPPGYAFGWADATVDGTPVASATSATTHTVAFSTTSDNQTVYVRLINITP